jgi:hypothetical protein
LLRTTERAAARASGTALPIAIPSPTRPSTSASLVSSPTAAISEAVMPHDAASRESAGHFPAVGERNSRIWPW